MAAIIDLKNYLEKEGPFDGVMAFSQGASLVSALLCLNIRPYTCTIRCAVFFCGRTPFIDFRDIEPTNSAFGKNLGQDGVEKIEMPTAHIWGLNDEIEPGQGAELSKLCRPQNRHIYVHAGGHEVPGSKDQEGLIESANAIRSMLAEL